MLQNGNLGGTANRALISTTGAGLLPHEGDGGGCDGEVQNLACAGRYREAANLLVTAFGPALRVFLHRVLGDVALVDEAYSTTSEKLWRGLPGFRWQSSLRSWCYVIARREASRCRSRARARIDETTLSAAESVPAGESSNAVSSTRRAQLDQLRATLSDEDRDLLVLRVEQDLAWKEIASAFLEEDCSAEQVEREAARLRQRFRAIRVTVAATLSSNKPSGQAT